jgi:hypothetical protein
MHENHERSGAFVYGLRHYKDSNPRRVGGERQQIDDYEKGVVGEHKRVRSDNIGLE